MPAADAASFWSRDVPVCFPGHSCVDYSPFEAYAINLTSGLTPLSSTIAIGCFVALGLALLLVVHGVKRQARRPHLWVVALLVALILLETCVATVVGLRLNAIAIIFGLEGPGSNDLYGAWQLVELAGRAMSIVGIAGLALTAAIAVSWARNSARARAATE